MALSGGSTRPRVTWRGMAQAAVSTLGVQFELFRESAIAQADEPHVDVGVLDFLENAVRADAQGTIPGLDRVLLAQYLNRTQCIHWLEERQRRPCPARMSTVSEGVCP